MEKQEKIKELYFECKYNQKEISAILGISNKYVSKVLLKDSRYKEEKEKRKLLSQSRHRQKTIDYIKNKRKSNINVEYEKLKQMHIQASIELSGGRKQINNRAFRNWNKSAYKYDRKSQSYVLRKDIVTGIDAPKKIKWNNF